VWGPQVFDKVPIVYGNFNVILGPTDTANRSIETAFEHENTYLEITVDSDPAISPRQQILSAPYALRAGVADVAESVVDNAITESKIASNAVTSSKIKDGTITGLDIASSTIGSEKLSFSIAPADYDSGWFRMKSQDGANSYKEISHNLGVYPSQVKVLVKAFDGENNGFIFEGSGSAQGDDDSDHNYGGVVFAYNDNKVRLWAPDKNNANSAGSIINIFEGWGGEVNTQSSHEADVKVLVWK